MTTNNQMISDKPFSIPAKRMFVLKVGGLGPERMVEAHYFGINEVGCLTFFEIVNEKYQISEQKNLEHAGEFQYALMHYARRALAQGDWCEVEEMVISTVNPTSVN